MARLRPKPSDLRIQGPLPPAASPAYATCEQRAERNGVNGENTSAQENPKTKAEMHLSLVW